MLFREVSLMVLFWIFHQNPIRIPLLPHACCMPSTVLPPKAVVCKDEEMLLIPNMLFGFCDIYLTFGPLIDK
jgi:hypothetical protein